MAQFRDLLGVCDCELVLGLLFYLHGACAWVVVWVGVFVWGVGGLY